MKHSIVVVIALVVGLLASSASAFRVLEEVEGSVELALPELTLPDDTNGRVQYRACATCSNVTQSVTDETVYRLNGQVLGLVEFLAAIEDIRKTPSVENRAMAVVIYDLNTKRVTRVLVHVSRAQ
jgi:hypothetical protein